jgi:hypothetical protein
LGGNNTNSSRRKLETKKEEQLSFIQGQVSTITKTLLSKVEARLRGTPFG